MGNTRIDQRNVRVLTQNSSGTSSVTLPLEHIRALGWYRGQKVKITRKGKQLVIQAQR